MEFKEAVEIILKEEGGYVNDPVDKGGETNYGISKRAYPNEDIRNLTIERAAFLYKRDYWDKVKADQLPSQLRLPVFDFAVNAGVSRAIKLLQKCAGVTQDGVIGAKTLAGAQKVTVLDYAVARQEYYTTLIRNDPSQVRFIKGWTKRNIGIALQATHTNT